MTTKDEPKPVEAGRIAHVMITPWSLRNGLVMWCGLRADDCGEEHFVATSPEAITCERCKANMRDALETLSTWVERLRRER